MTAAGSISNLAKYLLQGQGMLTSNVSDAGGFARIEPAAPAPDLQLGVVDPELPVHRIDGLRVADASIMPTIINANTNAPLL